MLCIHLSLIIYYFQIIFLIHPPYKNVKILETEQGLKCVEQGVSLSLSVRVRVSGRSCSSLLLGWLLQMMVVGQDL